MTAATSRLRRRGIGAGVAALVGLTGLGFAAVPAQAAPGFDPTSSTSRVAGADRFETAAKAATAAFPGGASTVILANGYRSIDALSANYVAGVKSAPILLTDTNTVPASTLAAITTLGAKNVIIFGDDNSVSATAKAQLTGAGLTIADTVAGDDRYETAADAYTQGTSESKTVFIARGDFYGTDQVAADALAAGPLAYKGTPILLTAADSLPASTAAALKAGGVTKVVYLGTGISSAVKTAVAAAVPGVTVDQIGGADRTETAGLLAASSYGTAVYNKTSVALANGYKVDALAAGPWAAIKGTPILLTYGTDALGGGTTTYLDANKATLATATVFGDTASVPAALATSAKTAGGGDVVAGAPYIVTAYTPGTTTFSYADPVAKKAVKATFSSTDKFLVGGVAATQGAFAAALTAGDTVAITPAATTGGAATYSLTNKTSADYTSGLVGAVDTATGTGHHNLSIVEPVAGAVLNGGIDYTGAYTVYTVDGATVSQTIFESSLSIGDQVSFTGTGADASHIRTVALTNASVSGTISDITSNAIKVTTGTGAELGTFTPASTGDTFSIDGAASTLTAFQATATGATVGDTITISKSGGVQTFALVNSAPSSVSGVVNSASTSTAVHYWSAAAVDKSVTYSSLTTPTYIVDGNVASQSEFVAAVTPGDLVTYQAADTATKTTASLSLTSKPLAGTVSAASSSAHTLSVTDADGDLLAGTVDYTSKTSVYSAGTSLAYTVDGATQTQAQFDVAVQKIVTGALKGTVQVSVANGVVTWALATTAFTTAPMLSSASNAHTTTVTVKLSKPVSVSGTAAGADFTATVAGTANVVSAATLTDSTTLTLTLTSAPNAGDTVVVTPTTTGAAKYVDAYGTALSVASVTTTAS